MQQWGAAEGHNRKLILNADNRGFAAGNNLGLAIASGEYLVMLNNDTHVTPGWVRTMVNHMRRNPDLGLLGPVTNNIGNEARIDIFYEDMTQMMARSSQYTRSHVGQLYPLRTAAFFCVMLKRSVFEKIGPLDEAFGRGFFEDDELSWALPPQVSAGDLISGSCPRGPLLCMNSPASSSGSKRPKSVARAPSR